MPRTTWLILTAAASLTMLVGLVATGPATPDQQPPESAPAAEPPAATARAHSITEPLDLIPEESLLCWYGRPLPDVTPLSGGPSTFADVLNFATRVAPLDTSGKLYARAIEAFGLAVGYSHALVLIDAQAIPVESDPNARRMDKLRFAAIIKIGDPHESDDARRAEEALMRIIQAAVNEQTDAEHATLRRQKIGDWQYQELRDGRLPEWATFAWGMIGEHFVLTVGADVWPTIADVARGEKLSLSRADWLANVRGERGHKALAEIIVAAEDIRQRLDPFVDGRATGFFKAWESDKLQRGHWALGYEGRAMYCVAHFMEDGRVRQRIYADPNTRDPQLLATIPETARYAIYSVAPDRLLPRICSAWLATQGRGYRENVERAWAQIQAENGFDAQRDFLSHLGEHIVLHNDPPHPLRIPLAVTTLTPIRDNPELVRQTIDRMCNAWQRLWNRQAEESGIPDTMRLECDDAGIWHIQYPFFAGPAWTVTDRFLVTSWSPAALRSYLDKVGDSAGKPLKPKAE